MLQLPPYQPAYQDRGREDRTATIAPTGELASTNLGNSPLLSPVLLASLMCQCSLAAVGLSSPKELFPLGDFQPAAASRNRITVSHTAPRSLRYSGFLKFEGHYFS